MLKNVSNELNEIGQDEQEEINGLIRQTIIITISVIEEQPYILSFPTNYRWWFVCFLVV